MKTRRLLIPATFLVLATTGCDKKPSGEKERIAELQRQVSAAADQQKELQQELEDRKLASERESIERERMLIEEERAKLEDLQAQAAADQEAALQKREDLLADREGKLDVIQADLEKKEDTLDEREIDLSDRDRDIAGREALAFEPEVVSEPVGDYGTFYDSLSSYGSWFETPDYGYVWQPAAVRDANWRPYARGRWVCSDRGWTWVSDEPFGWATYHYGRWALLRGRGWIWVPGSEWAPSWVSWRQSDNHIGWAPLPPETMAYTDHNWDSGVDDQFGISSSCFNFVEIRYFDSPLYNHCLPVNGNVVIIRKTLNITFIHVKDRRVICGGPRYREICDRIGRPVPFYRLQVDTHPLPDRDRLGMRPRVRGDRMLISAPNVNVAWNGGLRPKQVRERMESVTVERERPINSEIADNYRRSRERGARQAQEKIVELGGADKFDKIRTEQLQENRRQADRAGDRKPTGPVKNAPATPDKKAPNVDRQPGNRDRDPSPPLTRKPKQESRPRDSEEEPRNGRQEQGQTPGRNREPNRNPSFTTRPAEENGKPSVTPPRPQRDQVPPARTNQPSREPLKQPSVTRDQNPRQPVPEQQPQRQQPDRSREVREETERKRNADQARDVQQQQERSRQEQTRRKNEESAENQRQQNLQRQQQEEARRAQERAQRQQEEQQQREMQRQQEQARQRQLEENQRQRQQEENQRQRQQQEENQRQRQQEENQRQRQQQEENQRQRQQQEENQKQKQDRDRDEQRGRNR